MFGQIARNFRGLVCHRIHSRDDLLQEVRLFADYSVCDYFVRDNVRESQNALQPVQKAQWYLVVLVFYLQQLNGRALPLQLIRQQRARTSNVTFATPKADFAIGFNYRVSISC